jgi:hypothetical protein
MPLLLTTPLPEGGATLALPLLLELTLLLVLLEPLGLPLMLTLPLLL